MVQRRETAIRGHKPNIECCHHWIIDSPHGPISQGLCKNCGAEKEFLNYRPEFFREHERYWQ
jgi:hypothetical protein